MIRKLTICLGVVGVLLTNSAGAVVQCGVQDRAVLARKQVSAQTIAQLCGDEIRSVALR